jgi:hypothetical protein
MSVRSLFSGIGVLEPLTYQTQAWSWLGMNFTSEMDVRAAFTHSAADMNTRGLSGRAFSPAMA